VNSPVVIRLIDWLIDWLIHSFIHSFIDSLIHWFIDSLIDSLIYACIHSFIHSFNGWFIDFFIQLFVPSSLHFVLHSFIYHQLCESCRGYLTVQHHRSQISTLSHRSWQSSLLFARDYLRRQLDTVFRNFIATNKTTPAFLFAVNLSHACTCTNSLSYSRHV